MSLPCATAPMPAATAAAAPPDDPPGVTPASHGFKVRPCSALSVNHRQEKAGVLVRPMTTAPARRRFATTGLSSAAITSRNATTPLLVGKPRWSALILVVTGTPASGGSASPRARAASTASAASSASRSSGSTTALIAGFAAASRASASSATSRAETAPSRIARAMSTASQRQNGASLCGMAEYLRRSAAVATPASR